MAFLILGQTINVSPHLKKNRLKNLICVRDTTEAPGFHIWLQHSSLHYNTSHLKHADHGWQNVLPNYDDVSTSASSCFTPEYNCDGGVTIQRA